MTLRILLAARQFFSGVMIGMPPPTDPSNWKSTCFSPAMPRSSSPYSAMRSLLAVTTFFPCSRAFSIYSLAGWMRPISSTTIWISGSLTMSSMLSVTARWYFSTTSFLAPVLRSSTFLISILQPARFAISFWFSFSTMATPPPTVPQPRRPILMVLLMLVPSSGPSRTGPNALPWKWPDYT